MFQANSKGFAVQHFPKKEYRDVSMTYLITE